MFKCFSHQEIKTCKMEFSTNHISVYSLCPVAKFEDGKFPKPFSSLASDLVWPCLQFHLVIDLTTFDYGTGPNG